MLNDLISKKEAIESFASWLEVLAWVFGVFVAIGVVGETFVGIKVLLNSRQARAIQREIDTENEKATTAMKVQIAASNDSAAQANKQAAEAQQQTEQLRYTLSQRVLLAERRKQMIPILLAHRGQRFQVMSLQGDRESEGVVEDISRALKFSGWVRDDKITSIPSPTLQPGMSGYMLPGNTTTMTTVYLNPADSPQRAAIRDVIGLLAPPAVVYPSDSIPMGTILIVVNPKLPSPDWAAKNMQTPDLRMDNLLKFMPLDADFMAMASNVRGQFAMYSPAGDVDADFVARTLSTVLQQNGWKQIRGITHAEYILDFDKILICVNPEDERTRQVPAAAISLLNQLKKMKTIGADEKIRTFNGIPKGTLTISVGLVPDIGAFPPLPQ